MSSQANNRFNNTTIVEVPNSGSFQLFITGPETDSKNFQKWEGGLNIEFIEPNEKKDKRNDSTAEEEDPWVLEDVADPGIPWSELTRNEKLVRVGTGIVKAIMLLTFLYFFVCSLDLLSLGFRLLGGRTTGEIFRQSDIVQNPVCGVMIGILTTILVQSSSTSTSIIVSMVAAGFLDVRTAIPLVMGANIGTSITNTIVSLTQAGDRKQFRRAFAGATVHDCFNWLTVITLLIIELSTGYLYHLTSEIMKGIKPESAAGGEIQLLGVITSPFVNLILQLDKKVLECWAKPDCTTHDNSSLIQENCKDSNGDETECNFLFSQIDLSDAASGAIVVVASLIVLCTCLILIVKVLNSVLKGQIAVLIKKTFNSDLPYVPWLTGYIAICVGAVMTFLVQSSSVFTSAITPLVGVGIISIERVYPLTLGSNIGTTTTALLASLAVRGDSFYPSLQIALCHLFFNITGILIFYPIPFMRFPIPMAKFLGDTTAKYRWYAVAYMIVSFILLPVVVMGLSFIGSVAVIVFASLVVGIGLFVLVVNVLRSKRPSVLPPVLRSWTWLPEPLRSLDPYDRIFSTIACCSKLKNKDTLASNQRKNEGDDISTAPVSELRLTVTDSQLVPEQKLGYTNTAFVN